MKRFSYLGPISSFEDWSIAINMYVYLKLVDCFQAQLTKRRAVCSAAYTWASPLNSAFGSGPAVLYHTWDHPTQLPNVVIRGTRICVSSVFSGQSGQRTAADEKKPNPLLMKRFISSFDAAATNYVILCPLTFSHDESQRQNSSRGMEHI